MVPTWLGRLRISYTSPIIGINLDVFLNSTPIYKMILTYFLLKNGMIFLIYPLFNLFEVNTIYACFNNDIFSKKA